MAIIHYIIAVDGAKFKVEFHSGHCECICLQIAEQIQAFNTPSLRLHLIVMA